MHSSPNEWALMAGEREKTTPSASLGWWWQGLHCAPLMFRRKSLTPPTRIHPPPQKLCKWKYLMAFEWTYTYDSAKRFTFAEEILHVRSIKKHTTTAAATFFLNSPTPCRWRKKENHPRGSFTISLSLTPISPRENGFSHIRRCFSYHFAMCEEAEKRCVAEKRGSFLGKG